MSTVTLKDAAVKRTVNPSSGKFVTVSRDVWVLHSSDTDQTVILLEDPSANKKLAELYAGYEALYFPAGQKVPAEWWNTDFVNGFGSIY